LGLDLEGKRAVLRGARGAFRAEFRAASEVARRLGAKYRAESAALGGLLGPDAGAAPEWSAARAVLGRRSRRNGPAVALLRGCVRQGRLTSSVADLAPSLLHMHANRLLRSAARAQEMILYDFLFRFYEAQSARLPAVGGGKRDSRAAITLPVSPGL